MERAQALVEESLALGVNFFDTAYIYPGSEQALGAVLRGLQCRERVFVSTKLPLYLCKKTADFDRFFDRQLARLQTTYIDYYFMHMLCDTATWERLRAIGAEEWIAQKKASGQIRNIGFSYHGGQGEFPLLLDAFSWDFCMVQYNYLDEYRQAGRTGVQAAAARGLPVFVMEPLRGGRLVGGLSKDAQALFRRADPHRSFAEWGLRWVWDQPEVTLLLSGMNTAAQLRENAACADSAFPGHLTETERALYATVRATLDKTIKIPCTGCGYCLPCPQGVNIPGCFDCYNISFSSGRRAALYRYFQFNGALSPRPSGASQCVRCGACEAHCPQGIPISREMDAVRRCMESFWYAPLTGLLRRVMGTGAKKA